MASRSKKKLDRPLFKYSSKKMLQRIKALNKQRYQAKKPIKRRYRPARGEQLELPLFRDIGGPK
jgi:hypothetical protein